MLFIIILVLVTTSAGADGGARPNVDEVPAFARWLVSQGKFGVLATLNAMVPFVYVASYSDAGTGSPYLYLSSFDPAGRNAMDNPQASFAVSERFINGCAGADAQSPTCAKITLSGKLRLLPGNTNEGSMAEEALFKDHPTFRGFPKQNGTFAVFKLDIDQIFLVNKAALPRTLTVEEYLGVVPRG